MSSLAVAISPTGMRVAFPALKPAPALHMLHQDSSKDCNCALCCLDAWNVAVHSQLLDRDNPSWDLHVMPLHSRDLALVICDCEVVCCAGGLLKRLKSGWHSRRRAPTFSRSSQTFR